MSPLTLFIIIGLLSLAAVCTIVAVAFAIFHQRRVTRHAEARLRQFDFTYEQWVEDIERARQKAREIEHHEMQSRIDRTFH